MLREVPILIVATFRGRVFCLKIVASKKTMSLKAALVIFIIILSLFVSEDECHR
jgi:hypothetical protein